AVVRGVADDFHLALLPAEYGLLDQHLVHGRKFKSSARDLDQFFAVVGDAAAAASEGEARTDDGRIANTGLDVERLFERTRDLGLRAVQADLGHRDAEQF